MPSAGPRRALGEITNQAPAQQSAADKALAKVYFFPRLFLIIKSFSMAFFPLFATFFSMRFT